MFNYYKCIKLGTGKVEVYMESFQDKVSRLPQYGFALWGTSTSSSCTEQTMPHTR